MMRWHKDLTQDRVMDACHRRMVSLDNPGFCIYCASEHHDCEPDARYYKCEACGRKGVFGAEEILMEMV